VVTNITKALEAWSRLTRALENTLIDNLASTTPWLAPVMPAYIAWANMTHILKFPWWVSLIGALVVEFLGIATITTAFQFWDWNDKKRQTDQSAPFVIATICAGFYLAIILTVNVLLDTSIILSTIAKALLSTLSIIAAIILAVRSQHARRITQIEAEKEQKRQERQEKRQEQKTATSRKDSGNLPGHIDWRNLSDAEKRSLAGLTPKQIQEIFTIPERTARNWKKLADAYNHHQQ